MINAPGQYLTRAGLRVTIHEIKPPETAWGNCKGSLLVPSKTGKRIIRRYNIWHADGRYFPVEQSQHDIVGKAPE
jgi:hypothetical protein